MGFEPVDILDPAGPLADQIRSFVESDALRALLDAFSLSLASGMLSEQLDQLAELSQVWDFRGGKERNYLDGTELPAETTAITLDAARAFGLDDQRRPRYDRYDELLILGGLVRACFSRPSAAADLLASGEVTVQGVTALGGFRNLAGNEFDLASEFGYPQITDEFAAMEIGVRSAFGLDGPPIDDEGTDSAEVGASWRVRTLRSSPPPPVRVVAAPSSAPGVRRASTADTYHWFADRLSSLRQGTRLLLVTSAIYVPYQHADALRVLHLPYGTSVDTIGVPTTQLPTPLRQSFGPQHYLQEVRSMIHSYRQLHKAL